MSERFPQAWRDACLGLLKVHRQELHRSLGYKRMSWNPIRNEIMRVYETDAKGNFVREDKRLIRQNFDSWEKGKVLKDEKFQIIDRYIRDLALSGKDSRAKDIIRQTKVLRDTETLIGMYMQSRQNGCDTNLVLNSLPSRLQSGFLEGSWSRTILMKIKKPVNGICEVIVAYLPSSVGELVERQFEDVVFFEGYIIPMQFSEDFDEDGVKTQTLVTSLKLTRPEYRGISGLGYAEGEIHIITSSKKIGSFAIGNRILLDFPSPAACPTISEKWKSEKSGGLEINTVIGGDNPSLAPSRRQRCLIKSISLRQVIKDKSIVDKLFELSYTGYIN